MVSVKCMKHISRMTRRETRYGMAWTKHKEKGSDGARRAPALDNAALRHAAKVTPRSILPAALDLATRPTALSHGSRCGVGRAVSSRRWDSSGWVFLCSCSRPPPPRHDSVSAARRLLFFLFIPRPRLVLRALPKKNPRSVPPTSRAGAQKDIP